MNYYLLALLILFVLVNLVAFMLMWIDKIKSRHDGYRRISEGMMFFLATFFASIGVYMGMLVFRHKTRKWHFLLGIPMLFVENLAFLFCVYYFLIR